MRFYTKIFITCFTIAAIGLGLISHKTRSWHKERMVIISLCEGTRFIHHGTEWDKIINDHNHFYNSGESLKSVLIQYNFSRLNIVISNIKTALADHNRQLEKLGPNPDENSLNRIRIHFNTGIYEKLTIEQQVLWHEITKLQNWRPGRSLKEVEDLSRNFDHHKLETYTKKIMESVP